MIEEPTAAPVPAAETDQEQPAAPADAAAEKSPWDDPRLPWSGKPGKADIACWAAIVGSGLFYLAILPWRASLVGTHPVISELLNGSMESIIAAAAFARIGHGSLAVAVLAAIPGLMKFDVIYWWAGRLWGDRVVLLLSGRGKRGPKYLARVRKWGWRFTWPLVVVALFLPVPTTIIYVIAGVAGMNLVTFLVLDLLGTLLWIGLLTGLGYALGHHAVVVAQEISKYGLWFTVVVVILVIVGQIRSSRRKR